MRSIADVNVFLPLIIGRHPAHGTARAWFDTQPDGGIGWSLPVKLGMLRLLCNPAVMGGDVLPPASALDVWSTLARNPRLTEVTRLPSGHEDVLRRLVENRSSSPNLWTDAWLAALAECLKCEMVTFDRRFRAFDGIELHLLE